MPSVRLTVLPFPSVVTNVASRDALMFWAILSSTKSQETLFQPVAPAARYWGDAARRDRQLHRGRALGAQAAFVDGAVGVAFDLQQLHAAIGVLAGVCDQRAPDRAVRAYRVGLLGARNAQVLLDLGGVGQRNFETETRRDQRAGPGDAKFQDVTTSDCLQ